MGVIKVVVFSILFAGVSFLTVYAQEDAASNDEQQKASEAQMAREGSTQDDMAGAEGENVQDDQVIEKEEPSLKDEKNVEVREAMDDRKNDEDDGDDEEDDEDDEGDDEGEKPSSREE